VGFFTYRFKLVASLLPQRAQRLRKVRYKMINDNLLMNSEQRTTNAEQGTMKHELYFSLRSRDGVYNLK
jgi:hypothetical protein